jgi:hypothetical protein
MSRYPGLPALRPGTASISKSEVGRPAASMRISSPLSGRLALPTPNEDATIGQAVQLQAARHADADESPAGSSTDCHWLGTGGRQSLAAARKASSASSSQTSTDDPPSESTPSTISPPSLFARATSDSAKRHYRRIGQVHMARTRVANGHDRPSAHQSREADRQR